MKLVYKKTVRTQLDELIDKANTKEIIDYVKLSREEYINLLEDLGTTARIIFVNPDNRVYRNIRIRVTE